MCPAHCHPKVSNLTDERPGVARADQDIGGFDVPIYECETART